MASTALSFGAAALSGYWSSNWIFWLSPALGASAAAFIYKVFFTTLQVELNPALGT